MWEKVEDVMTVLGYVIGISLAISFIVFFGKIATSL
jgi:hypothetical protein